MIYEKETTRYDVNPAKMIEDSFSGAYDSASAAPVVQKPDIAVTVTGCISMVLISLMCVLTWKSLDKKVWLIIAVAALAMIIYIIYKHMKQDKLYKEDNSKGAKKFDYKAEYISMFPDSLPTTMTASELANELLPLQGKMKKDIYNNALRNLISRLNSKNNPGDILCKNINCFGNIMRNQKKRYYIKGENGNVIFYDADFMDPKGELVCDDEDVISYGEMAKYQLGAYTKGVKVSQASIIVEVKTGENEDDRLYFEVSGLEKDKLKKILGSKKYKQ